MQQCSSWKPNRHLASQEIPRILWKPKVHYRINKSPPPVPLSWATSVQSMSPSQFLKIHNNIILSSTHGCSMWSFTSGFTTKALRADLHYPIRATCHAHLIVLYLTTLIIFGEKYRSWGSFLHSPFTSSFLDPNTFLITQLSNGLRLRSSFNVSYRVSHPYKKQAKL